MKPISQTKTLGINHRTLQFLAQPFQGCESHEPHPQGSSFLATVGFESESLWDSCLEAQQILTMRQKNLSNR
jgi:hypothetical protein